MLIELAFRQTEVSTTTYMQVLSLQDIASGFNYNILVENRTLLSDFDFPYNIEKKAVTGLYPDKIFFLSEVTNAS